MTTEDLQGRTAYASSLDLSSHQGPQGTSGARHQAARQFDNDLRFEDPFITGNSTLGDFPEPPRAPQSLMSRPYVPVDAGTPPDFGRLQRERQGVAGFGVPGHQLSYNGNRSSIPVSNPSWFLEDGHEHPNSPPRPVPEQMEEEPTARALLPRNHPLRQHVERIRESRCQKEEEWRAVCAKNPRESLDINWKPGKLRDVNMKNFCTEEFELLESIERVEEGERYEDLNLDPTTLNRCLKYDEQAKKMLVNTETAWSSMSQQYSRQYAGPAYHPQESTFRYDTSDMVLPSIEKDSNDENEMRNNEMRRGRLQPAYSPSAMHSRLITRPNHPMRSAPLGMSHPSAAGPSASMMPTMSTPQRFNQSGRPNTRKPRRFAVADSRAEERYAGRRQAEGEESFVQESHHRSAPRIRLTAAALAQKHLRSVPSTFETGGDAKRQKLMPTSQHFDMHRGRLSEIEKFRTDPTVMGRAVPEHAVSSEETDEEDEDGEGEEYEIESV